MRNWASIFATLLVFGWIAVDKALMRPSSVVAKGYHAQVREAADNLPYHFGTWLGVEVPVPTGAVNLLRPNVLISRRYQNIRTGEGVSFLFVQVQDARDILGHFPPVCYPGQGWTIAASERASWRAGQHDVKGARYVFTRDSLETGSRIAVDNFLLLPDGTTCPDMDTVETVAQDRLRKMFGAGQMQLLYDASMPEMRRREVTEEFILFSGQLIEVVGSGETYVAQQ